MIGLKELFGSLDNFDICMIMFKVVLANFIRMLVKVKSFLIADDPDMTLHSYDRHLIQKKEGIEGNNIMSG